MTREEICEWLSELEDCLVRAEKGKKDIDLIVLLRWAYRITKDMEKETR